MVKIDKELIKAKNYALRLLTYRQRSEHEIKNKLTQKGYDHMIIEQTIDYLKDYRLVNDHEFAIQYIDSKITSPKPIGLNRMKYELTQLGIDKKIVAEVLTNIDYQTELDLANKLVEKTLKRSTTTPKLNKLTGLLQRRGFSYDIIKEVLSCFDLDVT